MSKSAYKPRQPTSLKAAVSRAVTDLGGFPAVSAIVGVNRAPTTLFKYTDESEENAGHNIPMDVAAVMTREAVRQGTTPHLLHWLQDQASAARVGAVSHHSMHVLCAMLGKEAADVFSALAAVLDPSGPGGIDLTAAERRQLVADFQDVESVVKKAIAALTVKP